MRKLPYCTGGSIKKSRRVSNGVSAATSALNVGGSFFANSVQFSVIGCERSFLFVAKGQKNVLAVAVESHIRLYGVASRWLIM
jgi:hypothetical protein